VLTEESPGEHAWSGRDQPGGVMSCVLVGGAAPAAGCVPIIGHSPLLTLGGVLVHVAAR
jgi:hypothetical protein